MKSFAKAAQEILNAGHILIIGHTNGDADCYGASFALAQGLATLGKTAKVYSPEQFPSELEFLFYYYHDEIVSDIPPKVDLVVAIDLSDRARMVDPTMFGKLVSDGAQSLLIDHHVGGDLMGSVGVTIWDESASSASELVYILLKELGASIDKDIATCLYAGIVSDTGSFQNQNTTKRCLEFSSELLDYGARHRVVTQQLFASKDVPSLKLWGIAMDRLFLEPKNKVVSTFLTQSDFVSLGLGEGAASGVINYLNSIKSARMIMFMYEDPNGKVKISFRTRSEEINVARLAMLFGGGGHVKAAGVSIDGKIEVKGGRKPLLV